MPGSALDLRLMVLFGAGTFAVVNVARAADGRTLEPT